MTPEETSKFANTCTNFNGFESLVCLAGVKYEDVRQKGFFAMVSGDPERYPCCDSGCTSGCQKKILPTTDQVQQKVKLAEGSDKARRLIIRDLRGLRGVPGTVPCPVCGRTLKYQSIPFSPALRFKCETSGCLNVDDMG